MSFITKRNSFLRSSVAEAKRAERAEVARHNLLRGRLVAS